MTKQELEQKVAELESRLASAEASGSSPGRIWPDVSKAVKEGKEKTSIMVIRGVHANPRNTVNLYPSQFARLLQQLPEVLSAMLEPKLYAQFSFRSEEERRATKAYLTAYLESMSTESK